MSKSIFGISNSSTLNLSTTKSCFVNISLGSNSDELIAIKNLLNSTTAIYIGQVLNLYYLGDFENVFKFLSTSRITELTISLQKYEKNSISYPTYEKTRKNLIASLQLLTQQNTLYLSLISTNNKLTNVQNQANILNNINSINQYLEELSKNISVFNTSPQKIITAQISEEYALYITRYGYPLGGVFDAQKLEQIVYEIQNGLNVSASRETSLLPALPI